jgi:MFS family permease
LFGVLLALLLWRYIRDYPHEPTQVKPSIKFIDEWRRLIEVCRFAYTWQTGIYACAIWTPIAVFAVLWGVPYLQEKYQISVVAASGLCSMIWLGIAVGSPLLGWLSDKAASRRLALGISALFGLCSTLLLLYTTLPLAWMSLVLFGLGLGAGGQTVSFAVVKDNNLPHLVGTASGFNNLSVLIGGAFFQPLVGIFLQHCAQAQQINGVWIYSLKCYQYALFIMPLSYITALFAVWVLRESHPEHRS